eukprot:m.188542 g.188542  ORF g.188542 m.188542 type:complete len:1216 (-) comp18190_c0_seq2:79-3726(-)
MSLSGLIRSQLAKTLSPLFKDMSADTFSLSFFRGQGGAKTLELKEEAIMELLDFPPGVTLVKATCANLNIAIEWTKLRRKPIRVTLDVIDVVVELQSDAEQAAAPAEKSSSKEGSDDGKSGQGSSKYGFVDAVLDGISVEIGAVVVKLKSPTLEGSLVINGVALHSVSAAFERVSELKQSRFVDGRRNTIQIFKELSIETIQLRIVSQAHDAASKMSLSDPLRLCIKQPRARVTITKGILDSQTRSIAGQVLLDTLHWELAQHHLLVLELAMLSVQSALANSSAPAKEKTPPSETQPTAETPASRKELHLRLNHIVLGLRQQHRRLGSLHVASVQVHAETGKPSPVVAAPPSSSFKPFLDGQAKWLARVWPREVPLVGDMHTVTVIAIESITIAAAGTTLPCCILQRRESSTSARPLCQLALTAPESVNNKAAASFMTVFGQLSPLQVEISADVVSNVVAFLEPFGVLEQQARLAAFHRAGIVGCQTVGKPREQADPPAPSTQPLACISAKAIDLSLRADNAVDTAVLVTCTDVVLCSEMGADKPHAAAVGAALGAHLAARLDTVPPCFSSSPPPAPFHSRDFVQSLSSPKAIAWSLRAEHLGITEGDNGDMLASTCVTVAVASDCTAVVVPEVRLHLRHTQIKLLAAIADEAKPLSELCFSLAPADKSGELLGATQAPPPIWVAVGAMEVLLQDDSDYDTQQTSSDSGTAAKRLPQGTPYCGPFFRVDASRVDAALTLGGQSTCVHATVGALHTSPLKPSLADVDPAPGTCSITATDASVTLPQVTLSTVKAAARHGLVPHTARLTTPDGLSGFSSHEPVPQTDTGAASLPQIAVVVASPVYGGHTLLQRKMAAAHARLQLRSQRRLVDWSGRDAAPDRPPSQRISVASMPSDVARAATHAGADEQGTASVDDVLLAATARASVVVVDGGSDDQGTAADADAESLSLDDDDFVMTELPAGPRGILPAFPTPWEQVETGVFWETEAAMSGTSVAGWVAVAPGLFGEAEDGLACMAVVPVDKLPDMPELSAVPTLTGSVCGLKLALSTAVLASLTRMLAVAAPAPIVPTALPLVPVPLTANLEVTNTQLQIEDADMLLTALLYERQAWPTIKARARKTICLSRCRVVLDTDGRIVVGDALETADKPVPASSGEAQHLAALEAQVAELQRKLVTAEAKLLERSQELRLAGAQQQQAVAMLRSLVVQPEARPEISGEN